jgi:hypothetical protein
MSLWGIVMSLWGIAMSLWGIVMSLWGIAISLWGIVCSLMRGKKTFNPFYNKAVNEQNVLKVKRSECFVKALQMDIQNHIYHLAVRIF